MKSSCVYLSVRMATLPESPATIDWSYYKSAVAKAGMVDDFEKKVSASLTASQKLPGRAIVQESITSRVPSEKLLQLILVLS